MPIDFEVEAKDGKKYEYYIPNTWYQKNTTATTLPKWYCLLVSIQPLEFHKLAPSLIGLGSINWYRLAESNCLIEAYETSDLPLI